MKFNNDGVQQWVKQLGSSLNDWALGISVDSKKNVYVTGRTEGNFDGALNLGGFDIFISKLNSDGLRQWTKQIGSTQNDNGYDLVLDKNNNLYLTGRTQGGINSNDNFGNYDLFLYKIKGDGTEEWYKQIGSSESDVGRGITIDSKNSLFLTGYTYGNLDTNNNTGSSDIFLMKFNSDGALQ